MEAKGSLHDIAQDRETVNTICKNFKKLNLTPQKEKELTDKVEEALRKQTEAQNQLKEVQNELLNISEAIRGAELNKRDLI